MRFESDVLLIIYYVFTVEALYKDTPEIGLPLSEHYARSQLCHIYVYKTNPEMRTTQDTLSCP